MLNKSLKNCFVKIINTQFSKLQLFLENKVLDLSDQTPNNRYI